MKSRDKADSHGDGQCHYDMSQVKLRLSHADSQEQLSTQ